MIPGSCERLAEGDVELYFYGELEPEARARMSGHLRACAACRTALEELHVMREALAGRPAAAAPAGGDWSGFMARLEARLAAASPPAPSSRWGRGQVVTYLAMAAMLTLISASVPVLLRIGDAGAGGRSALAGGGPGPEGSVEAAAATVAAAPAADPFAVLSEQHFARSKLVVLGLATKPADGAAADWEYERTLASSLLPETRLYRRAAEDRGLTAVAEVMSDLELVLLQASLGDQRDAETLPQLQRLIRKRDLVTKIQVVDAGF